MFTSPDAEKEFYKIWQKYGKERRKVIISLKEKFGQNAQPIYVPKWELYEICGSFPHTVIPQKISSNYMKTTSLKSSQYSQPSTQFQMFVSQIVKPSIAHNYITTIQTSSTNCVLDLQ
ncbi:uncharacterized protein LOC105427112 isoform X2 [Pogonomyrmex barbatus]|uniref:Uncharacterized protein LOC105427112 isoform X2 n=1 Tax=Pogonomyrmex barbatus TaxID=144034 RepID=A0A6I9W609_9HYME|nr:uncharacterized protein LOC105427112 isoform X2 [Pogonomyrmex barbatus]